MADCFDPKQCGYKTKVTYEIIRTEDGEVMNKVEDDLSWPATAEEAMAHKYAFFNLIYEDDGTGKARVHRVSAAATQ